MNYYKHHLGDYATATAHLTWIEDCAYRRLIDQYYMREKPIPADLDTAYRLVRAFTKSERAAVDVVLKEFFELREDGWHQQRCDEELSVVLDDAEGREKRKENERERQRKHREERRGLFDALREQGIVPAYNTPTSTLRNLLNSSVVTSTVTRDVTMDVTRDVTANHKPIAISQQQQGAAAAAGEQTTGASAPPADAPDTAPLTAQGVTPQTAARIAAEHPPATVAAIAARMAEIAKTKAIDNPDGLALKLAADGVSLPKAKPKPPDPTAAYRAAREAEDRQLRAYQESQGKR